MKRIKYLSLVQIAAFRFKKARYMHTTHEEITSQQAIEGLASQ